MTIQELPIGARISLGAFENNSGEMCDLAWLKVSSRNDFITTNVVCKFRFDMNEPSNPNRGRVTNGNNFYPHSNVHQFLNAAGEHWWNPAHMYDAPPIIDGPYHHSYAAGKHGFLTQFTEHELSAIEDRVLTVSTPAGSKREHGKTVQVTCKVSLPSVSELRPDESDKTEGELFEYFGEGHPEDMYPSILTRTGHAEKTFRVYVHSGGHTGSICANESSWIRPVIRLRADRELVYLDGICYLSESGDQGYNGMESLRSILSAR